MDALEEIAGGRAYVECGQSHENFDPNLVNIPLVAIVNMDKATGPGTHWTAFCFDGAGPIYYSDSLGRPPPASLSRKLKTLSPDIFYNSTQTQPDRSNKCGFYALDFCKRYLDGSRGPELYGEYTDGSDRDIVMKRWEKKVV
jgi:hypothetical protein